MLLIDGVWVCDGKNSVCLSNITIMIVLQTDTFSSNTRMYEIKLGFACMIDKKPS